jgi:hypothetical protein
VSRGGGGGGGRGRERAEAGAAAADGAGAGASAAGVVRAGGVCGGRGWGGGWPRRGGRRLRLAAPRDRERRVEKGEREDNVEERFKIKKITS